MYDLIVKNGTIVTSEKMINGDLAVKNGKIMGILNEGQAVTANETIDATGKLIFPGVVDMHFHCRVPGKSETEDFDTATMAASRGGVTTLIEMPICKNPPRNVHTLKLRVDYASKRAVIDFGFYGAGATKDAETAMALAEAGVVGYKIFLHAAPKGHENEFQDVCVTNNAELFESLVANRDTGLINCIHPEDDGFLRGMLGQLKSIQGNYQDHVATRIPEIEEEAVLSLGLIGKALGARVHACHITSENAVNALHYLKKGGAHITAETCPTYMFMDESAMEKYGAYAKLQPPLKGLSHRNALIDAVKDGTICAIASDHAPRLPEEKNNTKDFLSAPAGMPSVEVLTPMVLDKCMESVFDFTVIPKTMSETPSKLLGIYPKKGALENGSDADFFIYNSDDIWIVDINELFTKSRMSALPFDGMKLKGKIECTYVRGKKVYEGGKILASRGFGEYVKGKKFKNI